MHDDGLYLTHILESITPIEEYTRYLRRLGGCNGRIGKEKDRIPAYR